MGTAGIESLRAFSRFVESQTRLEKTTTEQKSIERSFKQAHKFLSELLDKVKVEGSEAQFAYEIKLATSKCDALRIKFDESSKKKEAAEGLFKAAKAAWDQLKPSRAPVESHRPMPQRDSKKQRASGAKIEINGVPLDRFAANQGMFNGVRVEVDEKSKTNTNQDSFDKCYTWRDDMNEEREQAPNRRQRRQEQANQKRGAGQSKAKAKPQPQARPDADGGGHRLPGADLPPPKAQPKQHAAPPPSRLVIDQYFKEVDAAVADYSNLRRFPSPPAWPCNNAACAANKSKRALRACECNIAHAFRSRGDDLKAYRIKLHPDKFSRCPDDVRESFQRMVSEIFIVVDAMWQRQSKN